MSRRTRAVLVAAVVSAPLFVAVPAAQATCIPGHVTVFPKPDVQLPKCDQPPQ